MWRKCAWIQGNKGSNKKMKAAKIKKLFSSHSLSLPCTWYRWDKCMFCAIVSFADLSLLFIYLLVWCSWFMYLYFIFLCLSIFSIHIERWFWWGPFQICCLHFCIAPFYFVFSHHGFNLTLSLIHVPVTYVF